MPPITNTKSTATAHTSFSALNRSRHDDRGPGGPQSGCRQVVHAMAPQSSTAPRMPGSTPAAKSLPMLVSVKTP